MMIQLFFKMKHIFSGLVLTMLFFGPLAAQEWKDEGELESVEIEVINQRQITLPKANRNFEKIPPRPSEPIKAAVKYDFKPFSFQTGQINPVIRPLKIKQENETKVYGGYLSAGYGNYASPYLEGFINSKRDKNKLVGAHGLFSSSDKGPVDGRNSGSGLSLISLYGKTFNEYVSLSGDAGFENGSTHFYGYPEGTVVEAKDIKQSYNQVRVKGSIANAKNSDFYYELGAGFNALTDKFSAKENEIDLDFKTGYKISEESQIGATAGYAFITRKDEMIPSKGRSLFFANPRYELTVAEDLKLSIGGVAAFENDSISEKDVHLYPDFRASYPVSPSVQLVASLSGGMEKVSLQTVSNENIWIGANIPIFHTNKLYDLQAALNTKIGNKVTFSGGFSFASLKNWYFFVNDPADPSRFFPIYDLEDRTRTNFFATLGFAQAEHANILLRGDLFSYSKNEVSEAWHRPTYKVTLDGSFNIVSKLLLDVGVIAQGGMKALDPATLETVELDEALDVNVRTEYMLSDSFSIFVQLNNITSNKYPLFLNYPVRGFQGLGGLTWTF
jgi:hypothetical protein